MQGELNRWATLAKNHWKELQPKRYAALKASGRLEEEAKSAAQLTCQAMEEWEQQGASREEAWEATRQLYLFPPEERERVAGEEKLPTTAAWEVVQILMDRSPDDDQE